jgi:drug/metabolite transporter (DMT)-like permease
MNSSLRFATTLALSTAVISGTSNFINKLAVSAVKDPVVFTTLKNGLVAVLLIGILLALRQRRELTSLTRRSILQLLTIGAVGGSLPFALFFTGLTKTTALNAALIHKTLFLWVILLAVPLLRERVSILQWLGVSALFGANVLVGGFAGFHYNTGELMILAATVLWAIENVIAKVALRDISSTLVAAARMTIGSLILLPFALLRDQGFYSITALSLHQWGFVLFTVVLLLGYVLCWYAALARAPASYVAMLLVPATLVTNVLSAIFITHALDARQIASGILLVTGTALVVWTARRAAKQQTPVYSTHDS